MRILGIDPGTSLIGYGIVNAAQNNHEALCFGSFKTAKNVANKDKVVEIYNFFDKLIKRWTPDVVAIESLFFFKNNKTVIKVSEIRGILLLVSTKNGVKVSEFTPLQIKQAVSAYGRADKNQVQKMVKIILGLNKEPKPDDVADALAVAICCANTVG